MLQWADAVALGCIWRDVALERWIPFEDGDVEIHFTRKISLVR
jgi:hypothetical protein